MGCVEVCILETTGEKDNKGSKERRTGNEYVCEFAGDKEEFDERKGKKRRIEERERKLGDPFRILQRASQRLTIREANYKPDSLPRCYFQRRACRIAKPPLLCSSLSLRPSLPISLRVSRNPFRSSLLWPRERCILRRAIGRIAGQLWEICILSFSGYWNLFERNNNNNNRRTILGILELRNIHFLNNFWIFLFFRYVCESYRSANNAVTIFDCWFFCINSNWNCKYYVILIIYIMKSILNQEWKDSFKETRV